MYCVILVELITKLSEKIIILAHKFNDESATIFTIPFNNQLHWLV